MRAPRQIYTDTQEHLGGADEKWFKWNFFVLLGAIGLSFGTYLFQQALGFVGMGINTVLFLILVWFLNTWLTSPTLVTGSWLAGLPFLRPLGFTADYIMDVVPFILFWSCGIVLVNGVVPWFWWPFLSYLWVVAITIAMGIWAWNFKPEGKIVKDLSWKFLVAAMIWALVGLPALSWVAPWFDPQVREEVRLEQEAEDRVKQLARQKAAQLAYEQELALAKAKNPAPKPTLSTEHYLSSDLGKFPQITLDNTGIVVTDYEKSTLVYAVSGGLGKLAVQYRSAFTGPWTDATLVNGTEIRLQPGDNAWQYRFYTARGTLKFDLERAEVPS
jgi:hypothetical protein